MSTSRNNESPVVLVSVYSKNSPSGLIDLSDRISGFEYEDNDTKADKCVLTVRNDDWSNFDTRIWHTGARLRVQWGYFNNLTPPRDMVIQGHSTAKKRKPSKVTPAVTGSSELSIECHDLSVLLNKRKGTQVYRNKTRSQVVEEIAKAWGYGVDRQFIKETKIVKPSISQGGKTDAELLFKLAKAEGFRFYIDYDGFYWQPRDFAQKPARRWSWRAATGNAEAVLEANIENDATIMRPKAIRVQGIDKRTGKPFDVVASNTETERTALSTTLEGSEDVAELLVPQEGPELVTDVPELTDENTIEVVDPRDKSISLKLAIEAPTLTINDNSSHTAEEAKAKADAKYREMVAVAIKLNLTVLGDPAFSAKQVFFFDSPAKRTTGLYYAKKVVHKIEPGSYTLDIESIPDGGNDGKDKTTAATTNKNEPPPAATTGDTDADHQLEELEVVDPRDKSISIKYQ